MSKQAQLDRISRYFLGYAPIVEILQDMVEAGYVDEYPDYDAFKARIEANKEDGVDSTLYGFLTEDTEHGRRNALYLYLPNLCIGWIPLNITEDLRP